MSSMYSIHEPFDIEVKLLMIGDSGESIAAACCASALPRGRPFTSFVTGYSFSLLHCHKSSTGN
jgi:hypothetical protein